MKHVRHMGDKNHDGLMTMNVAVRRMMFRTMRYVEMSSAYHRNRRYRHSRSDLRDVDVGSAGCALVARPDRLLNRGCLLLNGSSGRCGNE
ncbi:hypothetical protein [Lysobacter sp. CA199]|uniref:hypothetical protein n=1 Tax=Lysobacter sp. CA199 TaxID=3455608 RepID=UPI003F8CFDEC